jgi:putative restriction endonuclease
MTVNFWWVSQNQTYRFESKGGYIWCPKTNKDGGRSHFYDNTLNMRPGDAIFSFKGAKLISLGIIKSTAYTASIPEDHAVKNQWAKDGWKVDVEYNPLSKKIRPKEYFQTLKPFLPDAHGPLDVNGDGNQAYLFALPHSFAQQLINIIGEEAEVLTSSLDSVDQDDIQDLIDSLHQEQQAGDTTVKTLVEARRGQGKYRKNLLQIETKCRLTDLKDDKHLIASHIKPWKVSNNAERLDGYNGLLLSPHIDHLFDKGHITFQDNGDLIIGDTVSADAQRAWSITAGNYGRFNERQKEYLEYHRSEIFARKQAL